MAALGPRPAGQIFEERAAPCLQGCHGLTGVHPGLRLCLLQLTQQIDEQHVQVCRGLLPGTQLRQGGHRPGLIPPADERGETGDDVHGHRVEGEPDLSAPQIQGQIAPEEVAEQAKPLNLGVGDGDGLHSMFHTFQNQQPLLVGAHHVVVQVHVRRGPTALNVPGNLEQHQRRLLAPDIWREQSGQRVGLCDLIDPGAEGIVFGRIHG